MQPSATTSHSRERKKERKKRKRRSLFSFEFLRLSVCCNLFSPAGETLPTCIGKEAKVPFLFPPSTGHYNNISPSSVYSNDMSSNETTATVFRLVYYNICLSLYIYICYMYTPFFSSENFQRDRDDYHPVVLLFHR